MKCNVKQCKEKAVVKLKYASIFNREKGRPLCRKHYVEWAKEHPLWVSITIEPLFSRLRFLR